MGRPGRQKLVYLQQPFIDSHSQGWSKTFCKYSLFIISATIFVRHPRLNSHWDAEQVSDLFHLVRESPLRPFTSILTAVHTFSWSIRNQPFCSSATRSSKLFTKLTITFWDGALNYWHKPQCYFQSACGLKINMSSIYDLVIGLFAYLCILNIFYNHFCTNNRSFMSFFQNSRHKTQNSHYLEHRLFYL